MPKADIPVPDWLIDSSGLALQLPSGSETLRYAVLD